MNNKKYFKIIRLSIEDFKSLTAVEIRPEGRHLVEVTGGNGAGKSTVMQALDFAITGVKALPDRNSDAVRRGATEAKVEVELEANGERFKIIRTVGLKGAQPPLHIQPATVRAGLTPQKFLDRFFEALSFDPLRFIEMSPKEQVAALQQAAKVDINFDEIAEQNDTDYKERTGINREIGVLEAQMAGIKVLDPLPKEKISEDAISRKIAKAQEHNDKAMAVYNAKRDLAVKAATLDRDVERQQDEIEKQKKSIALIEEQLKNEKKKLEILTASEQKLHAERVDAHNAHMAAPDGKPVDMTELMQELTSAQRTNQAIDDRARWEALREQRDAKQKTSDDLSSRMKAREEKKANAIAKAKIPVPGIEFDGTRVTYQAPGSSAPLPLENLGEGEQLRIATLIGMAANPKLHVICIRRGEALDGNGLKIIADLAEQYDFQVWMARVDTSEQVGFVLKNGAIVARNPERKARKKETVN